MGSSAGRVAVPSLVALLLAASGCGSHDDLLDADRVTVGRSGSADFPTIAAAVGSVKDGARIDVEPGTYVESVEIERSVTLVGAGAATIVELPGSDTSGDPVFDVRFASDVRIQGFTFRGPGDGIRIRDARRVVVLDVVASGNGDEGVDVRHSTDVEIAGTFADNGGDGIQVGASSARVTVHSSTITGSAEDGVKVELSAAVTVHSSTVSDNGQEGVKIESATGCTVRDNEVARNGDDGILVGESTGTAVLRNVVSFNFGNGIHLRGSPDTILEGNVAQGNIGGNIDID